MAAIYWYILTRVIHTVSSLIAKHLSLLLAPHRVDLTTYFPPKITCFVQWDFHCQVVEAFKWVPKEELGQRSLHSPIESLELIKKLSVTKIAPVFSKLMMNWKRYKDSSKRNSLLTIWQKGISISFHKPTCDNSLIDINSDNITFPWTDRHWLSKLKKTQFTMMESVKNQKQNFCKR